MNANPNNTEAFATIDLGTGGVTTIKSTEGAELDALTFTDTGVLYGIGQTDACNSCLYKIDKKTAKRKLVSKDLAEEPNDHHGLAFNPDDGLIYHAIDDVLEVIDPKGKFSVTNVGYGGDVPDDAQAIGFDYNERSFIVADGDSDLYRVEPNGDSTSITGVSQIFALQVGAWRTIELSYSKDDGFSGIVESSEPSCAGPAIVTIFKQKKGDDLEIEEVDTDDDGDFKLEESVPKGKYYAQMDPGLTSEADCQPGISLPVKVK